LLGEWTAPTDNMEYPNQTVLKLASADSKKYKTEWKKLVESGMVVNVSYILDDVFCAFGDNGFYEVEIVNAARALRLFESSTARREFLVRVIHYLKVQGCFGSLEDGFDNFEDTAGGCDEVVQEAICYLLEHPEWTPE
jgi:hypothetical protein